MPTLITTGTMSIASMALKHRPKTLFSSNGNNFSGWSNHGSTINKKFGNPAPSFQSTGGEYAYVAIDHLVGTTITFDTYIINGSNRINLCNLCFGTSSSGHGMMLRLDARPGNYSGITTISNWTTWDYPRSGPTLSTGVWYNLKIQIISSSAYAWFLNGVHQQTYIGGALYGNYIAIHGDSQPDKVNGGYFDNITVVGAIV